MGGAQATLEKVSNRATEILKKEQMKYKHSMEVKYFVFFTGHFCPTSIIASLPKDIFLDIFCFQFITWNLFTAKHVRITSGLRATKVAGGTVWNAACIASQPNLRVYHVKLDLPDMQKDEGLSSCVMVGLSTVSDVDYIENSNFSYRRGYYIMIWKYYISYFSKIVNESLIDNCPEPKRDSVISIMYLEDQKTVHFYLDGKLLGNNPFRDVTFEEDYHLVGLMCVEGDSLIIEDRW